MKRGIYMEKLKDFVSNKRKTASLALIGTIILLICNSGITQLNLLYIIKNLVYSISYIGLLIYFIAFFIKKKNEGIVNNILLISFGIQIIILVVHLLIYVRYYTFIAIISPIMNIALNIIVFIYLANILIDKLKINKFLGELITNKILAIAVIIYFAYATTIGLIFKNPLNLIFGIAHLMILPYLYNYTSYESKEVSKVEIKNMKKEDAKDTLNNNENNRVTDSKISRNKTNNNSIIPIIIAVIVIIAISIGFGGGSSSKKSKWQSLTKEEKAWYERNYGNGKSKAIRDSIDGYKSKKYK